MIFVFRQFLSVLLLLTLGVCPVWSQSAAVTDHIVSAPALHQAVREAAQVRQANLAKVEKFLGSEPAKQAMSGLKLDSAQVSQAASVLTDEELSRLAARTEKLQGDVAAGEFGTRQVIKYAVLGAATTIIVWLIASHRAT